MIPITIEKSPTDGWIVRQGDRYSDWMCWDEMLGLIVSLTMDETFLYHRSNWMMTEAQHRKSQPWRYRDEKEKEVLLLEMKTEA